MSTAEEGVRETRGGIGAALRIRVELWLAVLFMALAFGAGIIVHAMYQPVQPAMGVSTVSGVSGDQLNAPPLTDEQIQQGLPPGHPSIGTGGGGADGGGGGGKDAKGEGASQEAQAVDAGAAGSP